MDDCSNYYLEGNLDAKEEFFDIRQFNDVDMHIIKQRIF